MHSNPWAQAVEAMKCKLPDHDAVAPPCDGDSDTGYCDACLNVKLRAALPHLLRAVGDQVDGEALFRLARAMEDALRKHSVSPSPDAFRWDAEPLEADLRTVFLAALTDAAGRVG